MKIKGLKIALLAVMVGSIVSVTGYASSAPTKTKPVVKVDVTSSATFTDDSALFIKNASKNGKRVFGITKDMTLTKKLVIEGTFTEPDDKDPKKLIKDRSMALEARDKNNKPIANYTLIVPSIIISSPGQVVEGGIIKSNIYVKAQGFTLVRAKVVGNIYFANKAFQKSFTMDATSSVKGKQEIKN
jgi:hypothetical protein